MNVKSLILAAQLAVSSIFQWPREGRDVLLKKSNTAPKMDVEQLALDHWRYVEGVLLRHGVTVDDAFRIGDAYTAGFLRGWSLAWYSRMFGIDCSSAAEWEWWRWSSSRAGDPVECSAHFREAFAHGWKHRVEVGG